MSTQPYDVVVVGAGQAGLGVSYFLKRGDCRFIVFERGRVGESWRTQRWDSLVVNTPNWMNALPGEPRSGPDASAFCRPSDVVSHFERYADALALPLRTGTRVTLVTRSPGKRLFLVGVKETNTPEKIIRARNVVVASGFFRLPKIPDLGSKVPDWIIQLHSANYRNASRLPPGAVVVVGAGQSGCQIAEDLVAAGRAVYLCTSRAARVPRRYRGRDVFEWWADMGVFDETVDDLDDSPIRSGPQFLISGRGPRGNTLSLQALARQGVRLLGSLSDIRNVSLCLRDDVREHLRYGDLSSRRVKRRIDAYIRQTGLPQTPREPDAADAADLDLKNQRFPNRLNLEAAGVGAVIWCTGFKADFSWLQVPALDGRGDIAHNRGVSSCPGLYFVGQPWMHSRKSGLIYGIEDDARHIAQAIIKRMRPTAKPLERLAPGRSAARRHQA